MVRLSSVGIPRFCLQIFPAKKTFSFYCYPCRRSCWGQGEFPLINQEAVLLLKSGGEQWSNVKNWRQIWGISRSCSFRSFLCHDWLYCCVVETADWEFQAEDAVQPSHFLRKLQRGMFASVAIGMTVTIIFLFQFGDILGRWGNEWKSLSAGYSAGQDDE